MCTSNKAFTGKKDLPTHILSILYPDIYLFILHHLYVISPTMEDSKNIS